VNSEDGKVTLTATHFRELQATLATLRQCLATREEELITLQGDVARMRSLSHALLEAGISDTTPSKFEFQVAIIVNKQLITVSK
jgi:DNA-binding phage protein